MESLRLKSSTITFFFNKHISLESLRLKSFTITVFFNKHISLESLGLKCFTITFFVPLRAFYITWMHHHVQLFKNAKHCAFHIFVFNSFMDVTKFSTLPRRVLTVALCLSLQAYNFSLDLSVYEFSNRQI